MGAFELIRFADAAALAASAAADFMRGARDAREQNSSWVVALSGGRIAERFFAALTNLAKTQESDLNSVEFFWSDERCVPPTDPESNYRLAREHLLIPLRIPASRIHRVRGEAPPELAAAEAEAELRRYAPPDSGGQPVADLVLLGLGEEGHVASLFPGEPPQSMANPAVFRPVTAPKPPPRRVTMGYPTIVAAHQVWVLVSGPGKEAALRESLQRNGHTPLAHVIQLRPRTRILTDLPEKP